MDQAGTFAAVAVALYAAHHVGDYWVQTDHQARRKSEVGADGVLHCLLHVFSYVATQTLFLGLLQWATDAPGVNDRGVLVALLVSGVTHYMADRREHGLMFKLARRLPGKAAFMELGKPREVVYVQDESSRCKSCSAQEGACWDCRNTGRDIVPISDNPQLATGAWALDQSWHIFWGVFVAALLVVAL